MSRTTASLRARAGRMVRPVARRGLVARARDDTAGSRTRSAVVFAPHPDDEVLGCGATIAAKVDAGARVRVVFATDGNASRHPPGRTPEEIGELRRAEARAAAAVLGVAGEDLVFLGLPDGRLRDARRELDAHARDLLAEWRPDDVFVTSDLDPHDDHRVACTAVTAAAHDLGIGVLAYPIWFWSHFPLGMDRASSHSRTAVRRLPFVRVDASAHMARKRRAFDEAYASRSGLGDALATCFQRDELFVDCRPTTPGDVLRAG